MNCEIILIVLSLFSVCYNLATHWLWYLCFYWQPFKVNAACVWNMNVNIWTLNMSFWLVLHHNKQTRPPQTKPPASCLDKKRNIYFIIDVILEILDHSKKRKEIKKMYTIKLFIFVFPRFHEDVQTGGWNINSHTPPVFLVLLPVHFTMNRVPSYDEGSIVPKLLQPSPPRHQTVGLGLMMRARWPLEEPPGRRSRGGYRRLPSCSTVPSVWAQQSVFACSNRTVIWRSAGAEGGRFIFVVRNTRLVHGCELWLYHVWNRTIAFKKVVHFDTVNTFYTNCCFF